MSEYKIDYQAMIQQLKDHVALELLTIFSPDEATTKQTIAAMDVFVRNGVSVETACKIIKELGPIFNKKETDEQ